MSSSISRQSGKRLASAIALVSVAVVIGGCGGSDESSETTTRMETSGAPATWTGPPRAADDGTVSVKEFNAYAETLPEGKQNVRNLAIEFVRPQQPFDVLTQDTGRVGGSTATVQYDLEDDSVRAVRYELHFALVTGGKLLLSEARVAYRCQLNRGHQDFSPELCL